MRQFLYKLLRRLPARVRAFLPEPLITPPQLTPAERTYEVLTDFGELGVGSVPGGRNWLWRVLKAAHQWAARDSAVAAAAVAVATGAVAGVVAAAAAAAVGLALALALVFVAAAAAAGVGAIIAAESNRVFFYTFLSELALIACAPLVFPEVPVWLAGSPFAFLAGIYFIQGIRGAPTESVLPSLPTTEEEVERLGKEYLKLFIARYAPEVQGGETRIDAEIAKHEAVRTEAVELKAYWKKRVLAEREKEDGDPFLPQTELDRAKRTITRADTEIAWLRERKQEIGDALATLKAHLEPIAGALTDYYQIQRADALEGRQSENTESSRRHIYDLQERVQQDISRLLAAVSRLQERLVLESGEESITQFLAGAEQAGALAANLDSASRQIEAAAEQV